MVRPAFAESDEHGVIAVGVYENEPKVFTTKDGKPAGIFIDILEHIAEQEGWRLRYVPGSWAEGLARLARGEIDLMPDVAFTAERAKIFAFHKEPVLSSWSQVYAKKGSGIRSILDLDGKKVAILKGSVQEETFVRLSESFNLQTEILAARDYAGAFAMVTIGDADAAISNSFFGFVHAKKYRLEDTAVVFNPSKLLFATPAGGSEEMLRTIDRYLVTLKRDRGSIYYTSLKRWMSEDVRFKIPIWLKMVGGALLAFLVLNLVGSLILKYQVNLRTDELRRINQEMEQRIVERTAQLAEINKEQTSIFETASTGIVLMRHRTAVHCNRKFEEIFGYGPGEMDGKPTRLWYPDDEADAIGGDPVYAQMGRGEIHRRTQQLIRQDGTLFWARISCRAFDKDAPLQGAVAIIEDITEEREAEERLRQALEKAQAADQIKSAFLATMSHELRTPLNSIIGFTGIMLQGLTGPLNPEQQKQMTMVQSSSRHLLALINDVLDISKIEAGQLTLSPGPFDLRVSLQKSLKLVAPLAEKKGVGLAADLPDHPLPIIADQRRIEQVVINVLNNAIKFTEAGQVRLSCRDGGDTFVLSFADTGIGIREEDIERLFQPFHQVDTGLARKREGTGLGLSICKKILDMMGGSIDVESRWGEGSIFIVRLPRQTGDSA
ncbi:MAG: transporter substrate-binding domain-containing protein [Proteobacteria bacterium]|nr:transporter substrate-binding domain-containing protein [Pseudomonadota bacterium]